MTQHVVSFSGGKDSTAMLLMMLEKGMKIDRIICMDTTKEFPGMYSHIEQVQKMIWPLEIEIVKFDFDYWFGGHIKIKGKYIGQVGYGWPDMRNRWCTALKRESFNKKVGHKDIVQYHGIAFDEKHRVKENIKYPLVDWQLTEKQALQYCYDKGLTWDGLYQDFGRVSCFCCPLSSLNELRVTFNKYPNIWGQIKQMDKKQYRRFRYDYSIDDLEKKFLNENKQGRLF